MKFKKEQLRELTGYYVGEEYDGFKLLINDIIEDSRWSIHYRMVFKYNEQYYESFYSRGATEIKDEQPYEDENDEIECQEVVPYEKVVIEYRKIDE